MRRSLPLIIFCYLAVYIVWGSTYYFIKLGVQTIPPFLVVGIRFFVGGVFFLLFCWLTGRIKRVPTGRELLSAIFMASFLLLGGNALVTIAQKRVDSYLAALVITATPLAVAAWNLVLFRIRLKPVAALGIVLGIAGVGVLLYNGKSFGSSLNPHMLLVLLAAVMWSLATSVGHRMPRHPDVFVNSGIQMFYVGVVCFVIQSVMAPKAFGVLAASSVPSMVGVAYLATIGSLTFAAFNYLLIHEPAQRVSSYSLVNPPIAVVFGLAIAGEKATPYLMVGLPFSLAGIALLLYGDRLLRKVRSDGRGEMRSAE
jgi:drug/metabolite transporter (DMT)-like permease